MSKPTSLPNPESQQAAEQALAEAQTRLKVSEEEKAFLQATLESMKQDRAIVKVLAGVSAVDPEAVSLLMQDRLNHMEQPDADKALAQLRADKPHLFEPRSDETPARPFMPRSAGTRTGVRNNDGTLHRAAKQAAASGSVRDVHEYMQVRRRELNRTKTF
jgi:hypothetical protein